MDKYSPRHKKLIIIGAGGFGREVLQYALDQLEKIEVKGFLDNNESALVHFTLPYKVISNDQEYQVQDSDSFIIAIGTPGLRRKIATYFEPKKINYSTLIHPTAYVAPSAQIGKGVIIAPFCFIGPNVIIEDHAVLNTYASCGHDAKVGKYAVLSPYATLNGGATVGMEVFLGTHVSVFALKCIDSGTRVASGSIVTRNIPKNCLVHGNPGTYREFYQSST